MRRAVQFLVVALSVVLVGGLLVAAVGRVRDAATRMSCSNHLKMIGLAIANFESTNGFLPPAAMPNAGLPVDQRLSWMVSLLPYIEANTLYGRTDRRKGWDGENRFLATLDYSPYQCPGFVDQPPLSTLMPTPYVGIAGVGTDAALLPLDDPRAGFFGHERKLAWSAIGSVGSLLSVLETTRIEGAWTAGGAATVRGVEEEQPLLGLDAPFGGIHRQGTNALFADGSVRLLNDAIDPEVVKALATVRGRQGVALPPE